VDLTDESSEEFEKGAFSDELDRAETEDTETAESGDTGSFFLLREDGKVVDEMVGDPKGTVDQGEEEDVEADQTVKRVEG
jgi:hypothetical protein